MDAMSMEVNIRANSETGTSRMKCRFRRLRIMARQPDRRFGIGTPPT
jgi:hypothetical protein